jgi:hypothetical protein
MQNPLKNNHRAFVKVVKGLEIYNFAYYTSKHLVAKFGVKRVQARANRNTVVRERERRT